MAGPNNEQGNRDFKPDRQLPILFNRQEVEADQEGFGDVHRSGPEQHPQLRIPQGVLLSGGEYTCCQTMNFRKSAGQNYRVTETRVRANGGIFSENAGTHGSSNLISPSLSRTQTQTHTHTLFRGI